MDMALIKGFCRRYSLSELTELKDGSFLAQMPSGELRAWPTGCNPRSGRTTCEVTLPRGVTEDLNSAKVWSMRSHKELWMGPGIMTLDTAYSVRTSKATVRLQLCSISVLMSRSLLPWDSPVSQACLDVAFREWPPEMLLDYIQDREFPEFQGQEWRTAFYHLTASPVS